MSLEQLLNHWRAEPTIGGNVVEWRTIPTQEAKWAPFPEELHPALRGALVGQGYKALYSHQADAWGNAMKGENVVVVTGTASGKTLCYNLPVLDRMLRVTEGRALYLYPTRALVEDQKDELEKLMGQLAKAERKILGTYTSDTPSQTRPQIRRKAHLVLSTPDMLHLGILPRHTQWVEFISNLQYVVIDEMHTYRGVFGSNFANVLRRLKRITRFYGATPQFILTSATIANPVELAEKLLGDKVTLIDRDGAPHGPKSFLIYNPPVINPELGIRRNVLRESVRLAEDLLAYDIQTVLFGRTRRMVELMLTYLREGSNHRPQTIRGYRSGYLPQLRREIEGSLRSGDVRVVVATSALELGVDIGGMGAALLCSYPGTIAATWQQAGRAGRATESALAVLVTSANPLDQFLARHPEYFFERSPEHALINPDNPFILKGHVRCATFELAFQAEEIFGNVKAEALREVMRELVRDGEVHQSGGKHFWMSDSYPAQELSIRGAGADRVLLQAQTGEAWRVVGEIDADHAHWMVHPEAIYLHEGESYFVEELDLVEKIARIKPTNADYYTTPREESEITLLEEHEKSEGRGAMKFFGELVVTSQVFGYHKVQWATNEHVGIGDVDLPPTNLQTMGYWLILLDETVNGLRDSGLWQNDPNNYGRNWKKTKEAVRQRDNYTCQNCGAQEDGRAHDVHHKIPFRAFSSIEEANRMENLVTLCPACHRRAENVVKMRSGLGGLAFTLRHLAPLFLMCDPADLQVISDPNAVIVGGLPVVFVYENVPGGTGFSQRLFELHEELMQRAYELVAACECTDGCPSCVGPGGEAGMGGKRETLAILEALSNKP